MSNDDQRSRIPNLMKIGEIPTDLQVDYDTIPEDPVVNNQSFTRFVLSNRGFLDSNSKLVLSVSANTASAAAAPLSTLPVGVGINSLIDRVALRIGTEVVSEITDFGNWSGYKSMFIDNEINLERETYLTSRIMNHELLYKDNDGAQSDTSASTYGLSTKDEYTMDAGGVTGNLTPQVELRNTNAAEFSIAMADLVPWLRFNNLPLYMFGDTQISLEIHWTGINSGNRMTTPFSVVTGPPFTIDESVTQFYANYIYYPGEIMARFAEENKEMNWTYTDYRMNKRSYTGADLETQQLIRIGGNGRIINKVITMLENQATTTTADSQMLNAYSSKYPEDVGDNTQVYTTNLLYNNLRLYPIDRSSPSIHFHDLVQTEQNVPQVTRGEYSVGDESLGGLSGDRSYNDYAQDDIGEGLAGNFFYAGYRLNQNARVNENGITLQVRYGNLDGADTYIHRSYIELVKTATLRNGQFSTTLA